MTTRLPVPAPITWKTDPPISNDDLRRATCIHDWEHTGVRWWIDASDPLLSWVKYVDQFHCRRCLEVEARPIDYRHRLGDMAIEAGTFAVDAVLGARLRDAALARVSAPAAAPATASAPARDG